MHRHLIPGSDAFVRADQFARLGLNLPVRRQRIVIETLAGDESGTVRPVRYHEVDRHLGPRERNRSRLLQKLDGVSVGEPTAGGEKPAVNEKLYVVSHVRAARRPLALYAHKLDVEVVVVGTGVDETGGRWPEEADEHEPDEPDRPT